MQGTFTIQGRLISLNELIGAARNNKFGSASQKKSQMQIVTDSILADETFRKLRFENKVIVFIDCYEKDERRDFDGITSAAAKIILDALVNYGTLIDDSRKYVSLATYQVFTDKKNPRIEVTLKEM